MPAATPTETRYIYVDESFRFHDGRWRCNTGGVVVRAADAMSIEIELETELLATARAFGYSSIGREFKYTAFFPDATDDFKYAACATLARVLPACGAEFFVSHAQITKSQMRPLVGSIGPPEKAIQVLSTFNIYDKVTELWPNDVLQMIVDLGVSEAFQSTYEVYSGTRRAIPYIKAHGTPDDQISARDFRRTPLPVFIDSRDSRLVQSADMIVGLLLCRELNLLTDFKKKLLDQMEPIMTRVRYLDVTWTFTP